MAEKVAATVYEPAAGILGGIRYHIPTPPAPLVASTETAKAIVEPLKVISVGGLKPAPQPITMFSVPCKVNVKEGFVALEIAVNPVESTRAIAICYLFFPAALILNFAESIKC